MISQYDFLVEFIRTLGLKSTLFSRSCLCAPWGLYQERLDEMIFHYLVDGECYIWVGDVAGEPLHLHSGDFVLLPRGASHGISSSVKGKLLPTDRICYTIERGPYKQLDGPGRESRFLCGAFSSGLEGAEVLLRSFPDVLVIHLDDTPQKQWIKSTLELVEYETYNDKPGQSMALTHLLDVLFVQILRWCLDSRECAKTGLLGAIKDPELCPSLKAMLRDIRHPWQLPELAQMAGLSRAAFAERFARVVGESPMSFLRMERLRRSIGPLTKGVLSVKEVAHEVGFSSAEVYIRNFEKAYGCSPSRYRQQRPQAAVSVR